jgi:hypothetical protein
LLQQGLFDTCCAPPVSILPPPKAPITGAPSHVPTTSPAHQTTKRPSVAPSKSPTLLSHEVSDDNGAGGGSSTTILVRVIAVLGVAIIGLIKILVMRR